MFSRSLIKDRGQLRKNGGGPSNTGGFDSLNIALDGKQFSFLKGFQYHIAYNYQTNSSGAAGNQQGTVVAGEYFFSLTESTDVRVMSELAYLHNDPHLDNFAKIMTSSLELSHGKWSLESIYSRQKSEADIGERKNSRFIELSIAYRFLDNLRIDGGYAWFDVDDKTTNAIGLKVFYEYEF